MTLPLYDGHNPDKTLPTKAPPLGHRGLWYDRFFDKFGPDWKAPEAPQKLAWIDDSAAGKCGEAAAIARLTKAQRELAQLLKSEVREFKTDWNFATGLGNPHPVENGFAWHPTLGTPYIAGSAVKGLVRAWIEGGWCTEHPADSPTRRALLHAWFGSESKDPKDCATHETQAGGLIFFDALPAELPTLGADVMTPHMGGWYEQGGKIADVAKDHTKVPADWHNPIPVPFLVVTRARFLFAIAPRRAGFASEVTKAMTMLEDALQYLGAGAKTAAGYGYMKRGEQKPAIVSVNQRWPNASVRYDKGRQRITATAQNNTALVDLPASLKILNALSEDDRQVLRKANKPLIRDAEVEKVGNSYRLLALLPSNKP